MGTRRSPPGRRLSHHRSAPIPRKHTHHASSVIHRRFRSRERRRRPRPPPSASPAPEPIESRTVRTALSAPSPRARPRSIDRSIRRISHRPIRASSLASRLSSRRSRVDHRDRPWRAAPPRHRPERFARDDGRARDRRRRSTSRAMDEVIFFASHAPVRSTRRRFPTPWSSRARVTRVSRWVFDEVAWWRSSTGTFRPRRRTACGRCRPRSRSRRRR